MKIHRLTLLFFWIMSSVQLFAQMNTGSKNWKQIVFSQPSEWFGTPEAATVAGNVLLYQRNIGGWPKNIQMHLTLSEKEKDELLKLKETGEEATIDNGATTTEMIFMARIYNKTKNEKYKASFIAGLKYLLEAQYPNGGWPQFYPLRKGYYTHITYNDNAIINVLNLLKSVVEHKDGFAFVDDSDLIQKAENALQKGIKCILKTQYIQHGKLTVWCAQHDENTLLPAKARAYELPSLSGSESAGIVLFLMKLENADSTIIQAINSAVDWFETTKITNIFVEEFTNSEGMKDHRIIKKEGSPALWARFYDLENNQPFFCGRDGIKKYNLSEIEYERRNGYSWYTEAPQEVLNKYTEWKKRWIK